MIDDDYFKSLEKSLREINKDNYKQYNTPYLEHLKEFEEKTLNNLPKESEKDFKIYISLLINHILEVREEDCFNVFMAGFKNGLEFNKHLKSKYNS